MPTTSREDIEDKNKYDLLLRFISLWQMTSFTVNVFVRYGSHMHVTTLELTTVGFVFCSFFSALIWIYKPYEASTPIDLECQHTLAQILADAGLPPPAELRYRFAPLDFISRQEWHWSRLWSNWIEIMRRLHLDFGPDTKPVQRIQNTRTEPIGGWVYYCIKVVCYAYAAIFFCAWNHDFPTKTEQKPWRASCLTLLITLMQYECVQRWGNNWWPALRARMKKKQQQHPRLNGLLDRLHPRPPAGDGRGRRWWMHGHRAVRFMRNNHRDRDPDMAMPAKIQFPVYIMLGAYLTSRFVLLVLDLVELRLLPVDAYRSHSLADLLPYI